MPRPPSRRALACVLAVVAATTGIFQGIAAAGSVVGDAAIAARPRAPEVFPSRPAAPIGTLVVPRLRLRSPIYMGMTDAIFDVGVGQWPGTARPGKPGNLVIGGHRTGGRMPFLNIDKLRKGDKIKVIVGRRTFTYSVTTKRIIKPNDMSITTQTRAATLTLFTCHPPHSIKQRYVVRATLTS